MKRPVWMNSPDIRPYVFMRKVNRPKAPGTTYAFDWFRETPILMEPLEMGEVYFADQILHLDQLAFSANGLLTPRWVFYDCAVMPGIIAGYAMRTAAMSPELKKTLKVNEKLDWTPISLWVGQPTPEPGRWMAQNFGSINGILPKEQQLRGLGFLTKGFALWYGNIRELYGVAQWSSASLKLHANYGPLELITTYTPIHDYATSLTYRVWVDTEYWLHFLDKNDSNLQFKYKYKPSGLTVSPADESSLIEIQSRLEAEEGPFFIDPVEILNKNVGEPLQLYRPNGGPISS